MLSVILRWLLRRLPSAWAGYLRAWRVRLLIATFRTRVVEHSYGASRLKVQVGDPVAQQWYDRDWPDLPEVGVLEQGGRLRAGARVFNIGAHQGVVAMILARIVGPSGQIIAVEANSHNCRAAVRNRELNGLSQLQVICAAVADKPGTLIFNQMLNGQFDDGSGALGTTVVQAVTLDGLADQFGFPDVVFLDIEGAECLALSGAPRVLSSGADFVVEVHVGCGLEKLGGSVAEVLSYFPDDQFALLARAPEDDVYHRLQGQESMTRDHFFLIAQRRDYTSLLAG